MPAGQPGQLPSFINNQQNQKKKRKEKKRKEKKRKEKKKERKKEKKEKTNCRPSIPLLDKGKG